MKEVEIKPEDREFFLLQDIEHRIKQLQEMQFHKIRIKEIIQIKDRARFVLRIDKIYSTPDGIYIEVT